MGLSISISAPGQIIGPKYLLLIIFFVCLCVIRWYTLCCVWCISWHREFTTSTSTAMLPCPLLLHTSDTGTSNFYHLYHHMHHTYVYVCVHIHIYTHAGECRPNPTTALPIPLWLLQQFQQDTARRMPPRLFGPGREVFFVSNSINNPILYIKGHKSIMTMMVNFICQHDWPQRVQINTASGCVCVGVSGWSY